MHHLFPLQEFMPRSVVALVERVQTITEVSQLYRHHHATLGDEGLRRMLIAMEDVGAVLIKLADRLHNMRTVQALPYDTQVCSGDIRTAKPSFCSCMLCVQVQRAFK